MSINHLIFTRFNIQYELNETVGIQPIWLDDRLCLFERYCLPSMQHQTCQNFVWILMGDNRTPEKYKNRIESYQSLMPQIHIYWVEFQKDDYHSFYKRLGQEYAKENDVLISTRLDNDDILGKEYIASVQNLAKNGVADIVSFPLGRQTFIQDNKTYKIIDKRNHFLSRIETEGYETIMVFDHTTLPISSLHIEKSDAPMWEEIVHGNNISNGYYPEYHYILESFADFWDLFLRWTGFQKNRIIRLWKTHFVYRK